MPINKRASKDQRDQSAAGVPSPRKSGGKKPASRPRKAETAPASTPPPWAQPGPASLSTRTPFSQAGRRLAWRAYAKIRRPLGRLLGSVISNILANLVIYLFLGAGLTIVFTVVYLTPAPTGPTASPALPATMTYTVSPTQAPLPTEARNSPNSPTPLPTFAQPTLGAPAMPSGLDVQYLKKACDSGIENEACQWVRVVWRQSSPTGVTIRVYAVTTCLHQPTDSDIQCVRNGDAVPAASRVLVASANAADGSVEFKMRPETSAYFLGSFLTPEGLAVYAYLVQAVNHWGGSALAIAASAWNYLLATPSATRT